MARLTRLECGGTRLCCGARGRGAASSASRPPRTTQPIAPPRIADGGCWLHGELETELIGKERAAAGLPRCNAAGPAAVRSSAALGPCCGRARLRPSPSHTLADRACWALVCACVVSSVCARISCIMLLPRGARLCVWPDGRSRPLPRLVIAGTNPRRGFVCCCLLRACVRVC